MAIHTHTTPSGVNDPGLPALRLLRGGTTPCAILTEAETVALLDALGDGPWLRSERWYSGENAIGPDVLHGAARGHMSTTAPADLSPAQGALQTSRRKELYEILCQATR